MSFTIVAPDNGAPASASYVQVMGAFAMMSGIDVYQSPYHFTAVQQAADKIDLSGGLPPIIDETQFVALLQRSTAGVVTVFYPQSDVFEWDAGNSRLQVVGATFAASDEFIVVVRGEDRGYDASINGYQGRELSPLNQFTQNPEVVNVTGETDGTIPYYFNNGGYKFGVLSLVLGCLAGTVTATLWGSNDESVAAAAATYENITLDMFDVPSLVAIAGTISDDWVIDTPSTYYHYMLQIEYATGANSGDVLARFRGTY